MANVVQGYVFESVAETGDLGERNGNIVQIIKRADPGEGVHRQDLLDLGPAFLVSFGDGEQLVAYSCELKPWYPFD